MNVGRPRQPSASCRSTLRSHYFEQEPWDRTRRNEAEESEDEAIALAHTALVSTECCHVARAACRPRQDWG